MSKRYALVFGTSEYDDPKLARLRTPGNDAERLSTVLSDSEIGGFDEVRTLANTTADMARKEIARFFRQKSSTDLLLLYFSGHGVRDDQGQLYLAFKDTEHDLLSGSALAASFLMGEMDRSNSRRMVLILDCCHSGAFAQGTKAALGTSVGTAAAFEGTGSGRVILTATDSTQYAWEGDELKGNPENSVFTRHLIEGLQSGAADTAGDGKVTIDELYDYVYQNVVAQTPKQTPGKWSYRQQGEIVLAKAKLRKPPQLPLQPELRDAMMNPMAGIREGAVRQLAMLLDGKHTQYEEAVVQALQEMVEDDSRAVSKLAVQVLDRVHAVQEQNSLSPSGSDTPTRQSEEEKREKQRLAQAKIEHEWHEQERLTRERLAQEQLESERREQERLVQERLTQEKLAQEKLMQARLAQEQLESEQRERERLQQERLAQERVAREQLIKERLSQERLVQEKLAQEKQAQEAAFQEKLTQQRFAQEQLAREHAASLKSAQVRSSIPPNQTLPNTDLAARLVQQLETAQTLFLATDYAGCIKTLDAILAVDSKHEPAQQLRRHAVEAHTAQQENTRQSQINGLLEQAQSNIVSKRFDDAIRILDQALGLDGKNRTLKELKVRALALKKEHQQLLKIQEPQMTRVYRRAQAHMDKKEYEQTLVVLQELFAMDPYHQGGNWLKQKAQVELAKRR